MSKLLCINSKSWKPEINNIGDIVGEYPDNHIFSESEKLFFDIIDISDISVDEIRETLKIDIEKIYEAEDSKFIKNIKDINKSKEILLLNDNGKKIEIINMPKYKRSLINLKKEEIELLKNSKDKNIKLNIIRNSKNNIKELNQKEFDVLKIED